MQSHVAALRRCWSAGTAHTRHRHWHHPTIHPCPWLLRCSVLYLAYKHADSFEDAVLANTNAGGENCHRGSALGAIVSVPRGRGQRGKAASSKCS
mgnify:CR=1 FL=1